MMMVADPDRAFAFLLIVACLGACFIRAFWQLEQARERRRAIARARSPGKWNAP
jgi:hypothetical protein